MQSVGEIQSVLGDRLRRLRLKRDIDQRTLAERAGVSERALRNLETGRGSTVETLVRTLKALDYLEGLEMLVPTATVDPLALLRRRKAPQRASQAGKLKPPGGPGQAEFRVGREGNL